MYSNMLTKLRRKFCSLDAADRFELQNCPPIFVALGLECQNRGVKWVNLGKLDKEGDRKSVV